MTSLRELWTRLFSFLQKRNRDRELDDEIAAHLDLATDEHIRRGANPTEARRLALAEFGSREAAKELHRESRGLPWLDGLLQDLRFALRGLRRNLGFTLTVIAMLMLGIGANTAIFSLLYAVVLRPLPVRAPGELVEFLSVYPGDPRLNSFWWKHYELFRDHNQVFSDITAVSPVPLQVSVDGGEMEATQGAYVAANFFSMLGLEPELGRLIEPRDDQLDSAAAVAVLSWSYWRSRFHGDPAAIGAQITVNGASITVIGVTPPEFRGLQLGSPEKLWVTSRLSSQRASGYLSVQVLARLKPGVSLEQAQTQMRIIDHQRLEDLFEFTSNPALRRIRLDLEPAATGFSQLRERYGKPLFTSMVAACLLLLLMCINVSGVLLARGETREREMALRASLGAGRLRLLRLTLTESLTLSLLGGAAGVAAAHVGAELLIEIVKSARRPPGASPLELSPQLAPQVLMFSLALTAVVGVVTGLIPAFRAMTSAPMNSIRSARSSAPRFTTNVGRTLVLTQVALSVVLLSAAGLFISHLSNLRHVGLGFDGNNILLVTVKSQSNRTEFERTLQRYRRLLNNLQSIPGVSSASLVGATPISGMAASDFISVEGFEEEQQDRRLVMFNFVGPRYFETFRIPVLAGSEFGDRDWQGARGAIVNQALAQKYSPDGSPIGKRITFERDGSTFEIVGLVGDAKYYELRDPSPPTVYLFTDYPRTSPFISAVLRADAPPKSLSLPVSEAVTDVFGETPDIQIRTMAQQIDESIVPERLTALVAGLFGGLGAVLAAIGLYGLLAFVVARRSHEIGIRLALGARRSDVIALVFRESLATVGVGLALGAAISLWAKPLAASVFGGLPLDNSIPITAGTTAMLVAALLAGWIPARRAAGVNPVAALKQDS